jgi:hypothetical protein
LVRYMRTPKLDDGWMRTSGKRHLFIKNNMSRDIDAPKFRIKTLETFVLVTIAKKYALFGSKFKLLVIIWAEIGPTCTTKCTKGRVVWLLAKETEKGSVVIDNSRGQPIYQENDC